MTSAKVKRRKDSRALLEGFWPQAFRFSKPQPLKVGIMADIMVDIEKRGLPFTTEMVKSAMALYTNQIDYYKALAKGMQRIDLDGNPAGEPTEEERTRARKLMRKAFVKTARGAAEAK
ncbi:ProQ/FinO family protein [Escherichia coli]|nr:ProQ/FinO family protein [Escherichia coli]EKP3290103.1 ProQ/FinO family protein [Escherichia coli]EKP3349904.1 ProQ/FinO family protein [Escherichia coli]EKP3515352.1 ProQ/FinO family protein [Escherichia coli]